ncbi:MAG: nuclease-related domain-containing protein [Candidatus Saccharimonadales bacterium]
MKSLFRTPHNINKISYFADIDERYVELQLTKSFPAGDYAVLNDILLPYDGRIGSSQIDHIVVSLYGIFCIETKSHLGWIYASKVRKLFTQVLFKSRFNIQPNPVEQNNAHIKALLAVLGSKVKSPIVNVVVFPSAGKFFIDGYDNIGSMNDLINTITGYDQKVYRYSEAKTIIETISKCNMKHAAARGYHAHAVNALYAHK